MFESNSECQVFWQSNITAQMREHLVTRLTQTMFSTKFDPNYKIKDPRLIKLVEHAKKTECEMYEHAKNQDEYFYLLAERIYRIRKVLKEKQGETNFNLKENIDAKQLKVKRLTKN